MRIRVLIPLWKRPEVTKYCFDRLFKSKHEVKVTCVISELEYVEVCNSYGFDWVWAENSPLGKKINAGIKHCLKFNWDYLMMMNSDDVIDQSLVDEVYQPFFESMNPFFGIDRVTYVNFATKEAKDIQYDFSVLGIGKCMSRSAVEHVLKTLGEVYRRNLNRGMDDTMMDNFIKCKIWPTIVKYEGQKAWDFKSEVNIHTWDKFANRGKTVCYSPKEEQAY